MAAETTMPAEEGGTTTTGDEPAEATTTTASGTVAIPDDLANDYTVTEGLAPGETIATAGASFLADGMRVRPWNQ